MKQVHARYTYIGTIAAIVIILFIQNRLASVDWNSMVFSDTEIAWIGILKNVLYGSLIMYFVFQHIHLQQRPSSLVIQYVILALVFLLAVWDIIQRYIPLPYELYRVCAESSTYFQLLLGMWVSQIIKDYIYNKRMTTESGTDQESQE